MNYLESLNERQKEVVLHRDGPIVILAGAGAGKTKTITHRILHLIRQGVAPHNILAITFTNKAATEMRERVTKLLEGDTHLNIPLSFHERPFISTFHSLGVHILKECAEIVGIAKQFSILDRGDSKRMVKEALEKHGYDPKRFDPTKILSIISREKGALNTVNQYEARVGNEFIGEIVSKVWHEYEKLCAQEKSLDFDDLLLKTAYLLKHNEVVRKKYADQWQYVHIDEYQDTNQVQYSISQSLAQTHRNICVVGDIDQTIYSWRGADISNILNFEKDYPDAKVVLLEQNYRSTKTILQAANTIIEKNKNRKKKTLFTENDIGAKIGVYGAYDEVDEAQFIALKAKELIGTGTPAHEIAVLYRANFQSRTLEEAFLAHDVPYHILGTRFYERKEIKDVISYLKAARNPDSTSDLKRIVQAPPRGIGKVGLLKILSTPREQLTGTIKIKADDLYGTLDRIRDAMQNKKPSEVVRYTLEISGLKKMFEEGKTSDDEEHLENIKELVTLATRYDGMPIGEGMEKYLEDISLASDQDSLDKKAESAVRLMTVHASKGLEFDYVFISGMEEDLFPHVKDGEEKSDNEEERRLFYVALTRARTKLYLSYAGIRTIFGSKQMNVPSSFVNDIEQDLLEIENSNHAPSPRRVIYFD